MQFNRQYFLFALLLALPLFSTGVNATACGVFNGNQPACDSLANSACTYAGGICSGTGWTCADVTGDGNAVIAENACGNMGGLGCAWVTGTCVSSGGGGGMPSPTATISGLIRYMHNNSPAGNVNLTAWSYPQSPYMPQDTLNSTLTNSDGTYSLFVNTSTQFEPFRPFTMFAKVYATDGNVTFVTPALPPAPPTDKSNVTLYLSPVVTVRVSPTFYGVPLGTGQYENCSFDGVVMDQQVAIPYEFFRNKTQPYDIVLPQDRNYSIVLMTPPPMPGVCDMGSPPKQINNAGETDGLFTNTSAINPNDLTQPTVRNLYPEMNFSRVVLTGYFKINGTEDVLTPNITFQNPLIYIEIMQRDNYRFLPPDARFPFKALNSTDDFVNGTTGEFRITITSGSNYIVGGFANNNSNLSWGGYENFTNLGGDLQKNITLYPFTGKRHNGAAVTNPLPGIDFMSADDVTTNQITINVTSDVGGQPGGTAIMNAPLNLYVTYPNGMKIQWLLTGGRGSGEKSFSVPAGTGITLEAFNPGFAPIKLVYNSTQIQTYVDNNNSVIPVQMKRFDVRKPRRMPGNASEIMNLTSQVRMQFLKSNSTCSVPNAPSSCNIGSGVDDARSFDPTTAMMLGKTDILMTQSTSRGNITIKYVGASLMSTAPPDAQYMDTPTERSADGTHETWRFGSSAPKIYDYALVAMPYNSSLVNENAQMRARIPLLYDQNGALIYNKTDPALNTTPTDYDDYDDRWFNGSDVICDPTIQTGLCYQDKARDTIWMKMVHFSEVGPELETGLPGAPNITLYYSPLNNSWKNNPSAYTDFNFSVSDDDLADLSCSLYVNGALNATNTSVVKDTNTTLSLTGTYSNTTYTWFISCTDFSNYTTNTSVRTFTIDTTVPSITITVPQDTTWTNSLQLNFTAIHGFSGSTLSCNKTLNGVTTTIGNVIEPVPNVTTMSGVAPGANYLNVTCADQAGNVNTSATVTFNSDPSPPIVSLLSPLLNYIAGLPTLLVNYLATDDVATTVNCSTYLNGALNNTNASVINNTAFSYNITGLTENQYSLSVNCTDNLSNMGVNATTFMVDLGYPSVILASPQATIYNTGTLNLNFTATDTFSETLACNRTLGGTSTPIGNVPWNAPNVTSITASEGSNSLNVTCADWANHVNISQTVTFTVDTIAPAITLISPATGNTSSSTVLVNVSVVDAQSATLNCSIYRNGGLVWNNGTWPNATNILNDTALTEGPNYLNATCTDLAGNSNTTATAVVTADLNDPFITITTPQSSQTYKTVNLNFTANDTLSTLLVCNQTLNGAESLIGAVTRGVPNVTTPAWVQGSNALNVSCMDEMGRENTSTTLTFTFDSVAPAISLLAPANGSTKSSTSVLLNVSVVDALSSTLDCSVQLDGASAWNNASWPNGTNIQNVTILAEGVHYVNATCTDLALNSNTTSTNSFTVDLVPSIIIYTPTTALTNSVNLNFTAIDTIGATLSCNRTINGASTVIGTVSNGVANVTAPSWNQGSNSVNVTCADSNGNINTSQTVTFTFDSLAPVVSIIEPVNGYNTSAQSVFVNVSVADALSSVLNCSIKIDGTSVWSNATQPNGTNIQQTIANVTEGTRSLNATCADTLGNSNTPATASFTVDLSAPSITSANITPSRAYNGTSVVLSLVATDSTAVASVVANITRPSGTTYLLPLAGSDSVWSNTTLVDEVGMYTAVLNATDLLGWSSTRTLTFLSAVNTTITYNITNSTGGTPNVIIAILAPENDGTLNTSTSSNETLSTPAGIVTIRIVDTNTKVAIDLPVNLTGAVSFSPIIQQENATAVVSAPTYNIPLLVQTISPNITIYANATLRFNYSTLGVSASEAYRLRVNKCSTYNASSNSCTGTWTELTTSVDNTTQIVTANVSSFSTFMLANKTSICGNSITETGEACDGSTCKADCSGLLDTGGGSTGGSTPSSSSTSPPPSTIKETKIISSIMPGVAATITISKAELLVSQITLESFVKAENVSVTVEKLDSKPGAITALPTITGKIYKYLEISSSIASANLSKAKIKFKVETKWITSNNYSSSTISLTRYSAKAWSKLPTKFLNSDANNSYFEAESPGFSTFAITGEKYVPVPAVEQPKPTETPVETPTPIEPTPTALTPVVALISQSDIDAATAGLNAIVPQTDDARTLLERAKIKIAEAQEAFNSNEQARSKQLLDEANLLIEEAAGLKSSVVSKGKSGLYTILLLLVILAVGAYAYTTRPKTKASTSKLASLKEERSTIIAMKKNAEREYLNRKIDKDSYNKMLADYESKLIEVNTRIGQIEKETN